MLTICRIEHVNGVGARRSIMKVLVSARALKYCLAIALALSLAACARNSADGDALNGAANGGPNAAGGVPGSFQDFSANVGDRVFFETDSTELTSTAQATLDKQATWLNRYANYSFTIEGHADERGTREYNFALGARRGETTKNYLVAKGVAATRIKTISYGKERPVAVCDDISCWSQNRRAVTVLAGAPSS
jgi:peptidoglycan-associated lipoprotein